MRNKKMPFYLLILLFMINLVFCKFSVDKTKEYKGRNAKLQSDVQALKGEYHNLKLQNDKLSKNYSEAKKKLN